MLLDDPLVLGNHALLIDSRDFRQIDVGLLSNLEILDVRTHIDDLDATPDNADDPWLFSRDCLEVEVAVGGNRRLSLFINHLKVQIRRVGRTPVACDAFRETQGHCTQSQTRRGMLSDD